MLPVLPVAYKERREGRESTIERECERESVIKKERKKKIGERQIKEYGE